MSNVRIIAGNKVDSTRAEMVAACLRFEGGTEEEHYILTQCR
jgi:hypothetical protein